LLEINSQQRVSEGKFLRQTLEALPGLGSSSVGRRVYGRKAWWPAVSIQKMSWANIPEPRAVFAHTSDVRSSTTDSQRVSRSVNTWRQVTIYLVSTITTLKAW